MKSSLLIWHLLCTWFQIDGEEFVNFCGLLRKQELYLHILKCKFKIICPHWDKAHCFRASLWRPFQAVSYDAKKKETSFLIPKQKRKKWQATIHYCFFFSCSVRKKADIVVFVQDIFLHDLQFSHSLGLVKHSHFISKAKDVL